MLAGDPRPLATARGAHERHFGTCRDFALMLCSFLRATGVASRLRCGFAAYLGPGWEDHWLCEYQDAAGAWRLCDPQMDATLRRRLAIAFDPRTCPATLS